MTGQEMVDAILEWASDDENDFFDTSFVESLQEQLVYRELTSAQMEALQRIIERFGI